LASNAVVVVVVVVVESVTLQQDESIQIMSTAKNSAGSFSLYYSVVLAIFTRAHTYAVTYNAARHSADAFFEANAMF
jgi:hypothetical protein